MFFFSSRRRHTRLTCDWSSDVCSSDLERGVCRNGARGHRRGHVIHWILHLRLPDLGDLAFEKVRKRVREHVVCVRSEERREGKSVDLGGRRIMKKKKR